MASTALLRSLVSGLFVITALLAVDARRQEMRLAAITFMLGIVANLGLAPLNVHGAQELSARDIMEKNFFVSKAKSLKTDSTVLINDKGQRRKRKNTTRVNLQSNDVDPNCGKPAPAYRVIDIRVFLADSVSQSTN